MKSRSIIVSLFLALFATTSAQTPAAETPGLPPGEADAKARLNTSPRHGEWVDIAVPGSKTPLKSWIVYPERNEQVPVVIIIHEIYGESDWIRALADQVAKDGFIAIAPDLLSGHGKDAGGTDSYPGRDDVTKAVRELKQDDVMVQLDAVRDYGMKLPASNGKTATIGFCWGGGKSFAYAAHQPALSAAVVFYGTAPAADELEKIKAPVLGNYGGNDGRVTSTVEPTKAAMAKAKKSYDPHVYAGAGHGFMRAQDAQGGANLKAAQEAWPLTIKFLADNTK